VAGTKIGDLMSVWHSNAFGKIVDICPLFNFQAVMSWENGINEKRK